MFQLSFPSPVSRFCSRAFRSLLVATLGLVIAPLCRALDAPVASNAQPGVAQLMTFLNSAQGNFILAGQQESMDWFGVSNEPQFNAIQTATGKLPAVRGLDFIFNTYTGNNARTVATNAIAWARRGGIVTLCCHMFMDIGSPPGNPQFYVPATNNGTGTTFDIRQAVINGTPENIEYLAKLDILAGELKKLRDAGVPVIWRPFHECSGGWFWWGAKGAEPLKQAWRIMFDRFNTLHALNNLIWCFNPTDSGTALGNNLTNWYPGDDVVDMISNDVYPSAGTHPSFAADYVRMRDFKAGRKVIAMSENGAIPDPDTMFTEGAGWSYFCTWNGFETNPAQNSAAFMTKVYNHAKVITLDELPALYVAFPLTFTTQPLTPTIVIPGQSTSFTIAVTGYPIPTLQWQRLPAGSSTWVNVSNSGSYSGATTATLTISNISAGMSGDQFRCVATNTAGPTASSTALLSAVVAPSNAIVSITVE